VQPPQSSPALAVPSAARSRTVASRSSNQAARAGSSEIERRYILRVLKAVGGNKSQAASVLGFDRRTLYRKLKHYGMPGDAA
jgi:two-component system response regulator HydG